MKRIFVALLALCFVLTVCMAAPLSFNKADFADESHVNNGFYIIIDAGHGGMDGGTSAADGTLEKNINLALAQKLNILLKAAGFKTVMLRESDALIGDNSLSTVRARKISDIKTRLAIIESYADALLISIHQNHYSVSKYKGSQVFYSPNNSESELLAKEIQNAIKSKLQPDNNRKIKRSGTDIYLLYNTTLPAVMVECGFMSNAEEAELLKSNAYQAKIAFSIMHGIINYLE